jgi:hypothetical protein
MREAIGAALRGQGAGSQLPQPGREACREQSGWPGNAQTNGHTLGTALHLALHLSFSAPC